jgi:hypothetical protein
MGIKHVDLLKVDVEGAELLVLKGAVNTLSQVNHIILEIHKTTEVEKLRNILSLYNFKVHLLGFYHIHAHKIDPKRICSRISASNMNARVERS